MTRLFLKPVFLSLILLAAGWPAGLSARVIPVTNLQDSGAGSLRAAVEAGGPRTVVFKVAGKVELKGPLHVNHPNLRIFGRTAPGKGVCICGESLIIKAAAVTVEGLCGRISVADGIQADIAEAVCGVCPCTVNKPFRSLIPATDFDWDGLPDAWERRNGLNWQDPADSADDPDWDGTTHLDTWLADSSACLKGAARPESPRLHPDDFAHHVRFFNTMEPERVVNRIPNEAAWSWMQGQVPLFACSDAEIEEMYYFRWWALRKHLKSVGTYSVYTEFIELDTKAPFIPPERTIASALGHHFMETRWLRDQSADDSYLDYWMVGNDGKPQGHFHKYSSWLMEALWNRYLVTGDLPFLLERFDRLLADYRRWQDEQQREDGLYWQYDVWDAMEESISGSREEKNIRPTINSYMYGNAVALAHLARLAGRPAIADILLEEAAELREKVLETLWNPDRSFFEVVHENGEHANVREAIGFIPWYFNLPERGAGYEAAWSQLTDPHGFWAPYGLTTAEMRHPEFRSHGIGTCEWDGAVWPYATSQTLGALANVLRFYPDAPVKREDYMDAFVTYTRAQFYDGLPYIGEYQDERTGVWLKGREPRSYYYHHSTYADLLITDLIGLQPSPVNEVHLDPLLPEGEWDWFCIDGIRYKGHELTLFYDVDGTHLGEAPGLHIWIDGEPVAHRRDLGPLRAELPETEVTP